MYIFLVSYFLSWGSEGSLRSCHSLERNNKWMNAHSQHYCFLLFCVHVHAHLCSFTHSYLVKEVNITQVQYVTGTNCPRPHLSSWGSLLTWRSWLSLGTLRHRKKIKWWQSGGQMRKRVSHIRITHNKSFCDAITATDLQLIQKLNDNIVDNLKWHWPGFPWDRGARHFLVHPEKERGWTEKNQNGNLNNNDVNNSNTDAHTND